DFALEDALHIGLDVIVAAHRHDFTKVADGVDRREMVVFSKCGAGLMGEDAAEQFVLDLLRMAGRLLEGGKPASYRVGDDFHQHIAEKPIEHEIIVPMGSPPRSEQS